MTNDNKPMKGFHGMFNQELLDHFARAILDLREVYSDELSDDNPQKILDALGERGWKFAKDKFGAKRYTTTTYPASTPPLSTDELRIGVVLRKGALYFDFRAWGVYNND